MRDHWLEMLSISTALDREVVGVLHEESDS